MSKLTVDMLPSNNKPALLFARLHVYLPSFGQEVS